MVRFTSLQGLGDDSTTVQFFGNDPTPQQPATTDSTILSFFGGVLPSATTPAASGTGAPKGITSTTLMYAALIGLSVFVFATATRR